MPHYRSPWMDSDLDAVRELSRTFFETEAQFNIANFAEQHRVDRDALNRAGKLRLRFSTPESYGDSCELTHRKRRAAKPQPPKTDCLSGEFAPTLATGAHA
jgi:hypothetical protein